MSEREYREGIAFIEKVAGTEPEKRRRLDYWREHAKPLVGETIKQPLVGVL